MIKETKISDIFDSIRNGYSVKQSDNATGVPITRIETISNRTIDTTKFGYANISENNLGKAKDFLLEDGDILMTHINSISHLGKSALYVEKPKMLIHGMNLLCLRAKRDIASPKYLLYWFNSPIFKTRLIKYINPAVNQASVSTTNLKKLTIPLPPLPVQQKIAAILDAADLHRQKTKTLIEKYDQLTQSIFLEMFGDPVKNEKGWKTFKGNELFRFSSGKFNPVKNLDNSFDFPTYGGNGITGYSKEYLIDYDTIVIGRVGVYCGCVHLSKGRSWVTDNAIYIKEFKMNIDLVFAYYAFKYLNLNRFADVSGQPKITQQPLDKLLFIYPPIELQRKFSDLINSVNLQIGKTESSFNKSEDLFNTLLQRAFKGELVS
jgi:type I restriction enzyme, S subunit